MHIFITGGAGFIGCNLAAHHLSQGNCVTVYDNLSRAGNEHNLRWLQNDAPKTGNASLRFIKGDIRDFETLNAAMTVAKPDLVVHLAAQVAVTTSIKNPREDFEINALGTFNVLEAARAQAQPPAVFYASTNKVYGGLEDLTVIEEATRYKLRDCPNGVSEHQFLDFHSPYGCCYSEDTDILTRCGWKRFYELAPNDEVLTYSIDRKVAEFQKPTQHFVYDYAGKMYAQANRRLLTCVTPNHKMLVAWDCNHDELIRPRLIEAREIEGKPMAYLVAAPVAENNEVEWFSLPEVVPEKRKHHFPPRNIKMDSWLRFLGWYIAEGHCYFNEKTSNCTVTLTTYYRTEEAIEVMRSVGLSPGVDHHHVTATSKQMYEYVKELGKSHDKYIPHCIKRLSERQLLILLTALLDGDGNKHSKNGWKYTTVSKRLADDVQEIAIKCGLAASIRLDKQGFYRVYINTTRTTQCNLDRNNSKWIDYKGKVYCVEVPNSVVMVRQNGHAYFSGNSKGAADQYVRDYARIYGLRTVVFRQSCVYGERQFGVEDQGWVAHFLIAAAHNRPISIYGDGKQVRDLLNVKDLVSAYSHAWENLDVASGHAFNVGGGANNTLSIWAEFGPFVEELAERKVTVRFSDLRAGDQPVFISDNTKAKTLLGWEPKVEAHAGITQLWEWVTKNPHLFK